MRNFKITTFILLIFLLNTTFVAQNKKNTQTKQTPTPEKIDDIGNTTNGHIEAVLDSYFQNLPITSENKLLLITYGTNRRIAARFRIIKNLIERRNLKDLNIDLIKGGFANEANTEVWLVPKGTESPKIKETAYKISDFSSFKNKIWKREFDKSLTKQRESGCREVIYVIAYVKSDEVFNRIGKNFLDYLVKNRNGCDGVAGPKSFALVKGGISKEQLTTIWMIPENAETPIPNKKFEIK